jgi:2',3'-cyclic-nucleotide 2'-phosphodiesterase / 3'-nucleotidase / 5'-nucleotidase
MRPGRRTGVLVPMLGFLLLVGGCAGAGPPVATVAPTPTDTLSVVLLGTTDVHGRLFPHDYYTGQSEQRGLALLKPLVDSVRADHPGRTLLFDSGDILQGNPLGYVYARIRGDEPNPIIRAMNLMAYDAAAIGNHEFNYGLDHLRRAMDLADFPFVSANIYRHGTQEHAYRPFTLIPVPTPFGDTVRVGVTANTPPGVHVWDRDHVEGVLEFREVVGSVRSVVADMRAAGADIVAVLSHGGLEGTSYDTLATGLAPENAAAELARQEPGIDVIFLGHTHRELADTTINGVLLTQARNWAASLAAATLTLHRGTGGDWRVVRKRGEILRPDAVRADRAFMDSLRWEHERTLAYVATRIGTAPADLSAHDARVRDTPIIDFINEVQRRTAGAQLSATAAFSLSADVPAGDISVAQIAALYPYDNTLKAIRITGAQLRAYLEKSARYYAGWPAREGSTVTDFGVPGYNFDIVSGVDYVLDISRPVGSRVTLLRYEGADVTDDQMFTLALNNYRQSGGGGYDMIAGAPVVYDRGEDIRDFLIEEVRSTGELRTEDYYRENWRLLPAEAAAAALAEQRDREVRPPAAAAGRTRLRVLTTNDYHGRLESSMPSWAEGRPVGGAAALAAYFRAEREGFGGPTIILDGGDIMQGTPVSNLTRGRSTIDYYNAVGYGGAAIGNHEFDWSPAVLKERIAQAEFPWMAANILVAGSDTTPSWVRDTAYVDVDGVRVGLVGLITEETGSKTMAAYVAGLEFADGAATIDRWVPELRAGGADFVIVVAHEGAVCDAAMTVCEGNLIDWARQVRHRPDLMVGGHTHQVVRWHENGIAIIEAGSYGTRYGVVDLERMTADSVSAWIRGTPMAWGDRVEPDTAIARIVAAAVEEVGPRIAELIGEAAELIPRGAGEHPLGRLIADAQRVVSGADIAIMNSGGVRAPLEPGPITWGDLYQIHPFGNMLMVLELRGSDVRDALEHAFRQGQPDAQVSGLRVDYDLGRPAGSRVVSIRLADGTPLREDEVYRVVANDFLTSGVGDGYEALGRGLSETPTGVADLDALISYIQSLPQPIRAPRDVRMHDISAGS